MAEVIPRQPTTVAAAGGVVWRPGPAPGAPPRIALVHRVRHQDWTLPKGKLDPGEQPLAAGVREVFEETAVRAVPQSRLPTVRYLMGGTGQEKVVDYWSMRAESWTDRAPDDEVDAIRWVGPGEAEALLTYPHDRDVVRVFAERPPITGVVAVVRHAHADRAGTWSRPGTWSGPDAERPLDGRGSADAAALSAVLALLRPTRVLSATPARCRQTVTPLAERAGLAVQRDPRFDEAAEVTVAADAVRVLAAESVAAVVCAQGRLVQSVVSLLSGHEPAEHYTAKSSGWILAFSGAEVITTDWVRLAA